MRQNKRASLRVVVPALTLLLGSSLLVAGGAQLPVQGGTLRPVVEEEEPLRPFTLDGGEEPSLLRTASDSDCTFLRDPRPFLETQEIRNSMRTAEINRVVRWTATANAVSTGVTDAGNMRRNNFIDDEIFSRMAAANIRSAPISDDAEFLRRVTLDLTGRIPSATDVTNFLADTSISKRDAVIDALVASPEFADKWTLFFGDLFQNNVTSTQVNRTVLGRDALYTYLKTAISNNTPYDQMARELITGTGDSFAVGPADWVVGNTVAGGPNSGQDTFDGAAVDVGNMFMGISAVDCLLCHDGARHLDQVNLWGAGQTRQNLWGLSAYFSRVTMGRTAVQNQFMVSDNTTGAYRMGTTTGNRSARPGSTQTIVAPRYPFGTSANPGSGIQTGENYRQAIARQITGDLQFSRAAVNYMWERMMVEAFVTPSNGFDMARLDANNPPAAPWTLQPTNAQLLDRLARFFQSNNYNIRVLIGTIAKSSAYQLSSTYDGEWDASYVPYYARHYVRRLNSEELLDAVAKATNIMQTYSFQAPSTLPPVQWAGQLPDTREPTGGAPGSTPTPNGNVTTFLNAFGRGDRDINPRRFDGSVLQGLTVMNNVFVTSRIHNANTGAYINSRVRTVLQSTADPSAIIRQLYLNTLSRPATTAEVTLHLPVFQQLGNVAAAENLQWVLLNRVQFLFNY